MIKIKKIDRDIEKKHSGKKQKILHFSTLKKKFRVIDVIYYDFF
jgi:hypothetical protein